MKGRGQVKDLAIDALEPQDPGRSDQEAVVEIFADVSRDRITAARKVLAYLDAGGPAKSLIDAARHLMILKGGGAHDYKFGSAVLEDYYQVSPAWRKRYMASSMMWLNGAGNRDNGLIERSKRLCEAADGNIKTHTPAAMDIRAECQTIQR